jgi:hypothetical protein
VKATREEIEISDEAVANLLRATKKAKEAKEAAEAAAEQIGGGKVSGEGKVG